MFWNVLLILQDLRTEYKNLQQELVQAQQQLQK